MCLDLPLTCIEIAGPPSQVGSLRLFPMSIKTPGAQEFKASRRAALPARMSLDVNKELKKLLSEYDNGERQKLYKRAAKMRKQQARQGVKRGRGSAKAPSFIKTGRRAGDSLDTWVLRLLKEDEVVAAEDPETEGLSSATVTWVGAGVCRVQLDGRELSCRLGAELAQRQQSALAVGDRVRLCHVEGDRAVVDSVRPRRTVLSRADPRAQHRERVMAANMDVVVVVTAAKDPPLRMGLLDRFLVATRRGGAEALIVLNKVDLLSHEERCAVDRELAPLVVTGVSVWPVSAKGGLGLDELRGELAGKLCVFVGHSGVGKSSLLNALRPALEIETGEIVERWGRGRHTTTASTLHDLGDGICVMDTPGIRELSLFDMSPEELRDCHPELERLAATCKFTDCSHVHEPRCAVIAAVQAGDVEVDRYQSYLKLLGS